MSEGRALFELHAPSAAITGADYVVRERKNGAAWDNGIKQCYPVRNRHSSVKSIQPTVFRAHKTCRYLKNTVFVIRRVYMSWVLLPPR